LKCTGWASSLNAGEKEGNFEYAFFGVMIELTDAGQGEQLFSFKSFYK